MTVTDDQVAALRAFLTGDSATHDRILDELDTTAAKGNYAALVAAAFFVAVDRKFSRTDGDAEVIDFVASVRTRSDRLRDSVDPQIAERVIRAVYTDESIDDIAARTVMDVEFVLLAALVIDENLDVAQLDELLAEARVLAEQ